MVIAEDTAIVILNTVTPSSLSSYPFTPTTNTEQRWYENISVLISQWIPI